MVLLLSLLTDISNNPDTMDLFEDELHCVRASYAIVNLIRSLNYGRKPL